MSCTRDTFNYIRLTAGLLLLELLLSGLKPMPFASARAAPVSDEQSSVSDQHVTFLPLTLYLVEPVPEKIYCVGDSLTDAGVYEAKLAALLGPAWEIVEMGNSGETTAAMLARFQWDVIDYGDAAYVIIWGGANDLRSLSEAESQANLQEMYTMAHDAGIKVVGVTITPQNDASDADKAKLLAINSWMRYTAEDLDYVADAYYVIEDPRDPGNIFPVYDSGDHVHLSDSGYTMVAATIYDAVDWDREP